MFQFNLRTSLVSRRRVGITRVIGRLFFANATVPRNVFRHQRGVNRNSSRCKFAT